MYIAYKMQQRVQTLDVKYDVDINKKNKVHVGFWRK